jgi:hypothetical protein
LFDCSQFQFRKQIVLKHCLRHGAKGKHVIRIKAGLDDCLNEAKMKRRVTARRRIKQRIMKNRMTEKEKEKMENEAGKGEPKRRKL